jgi:dihydropteroate synthase
VSQQSSFAGVTFDLPIVMGIVNVTPDSFSDGGRFLGIEAAVAHARRLVADGAAIIDVGGESTRPGAAPVSPDEEIARTVPVVRALAEEGICVSIDTRHAAVMKATVEAGAAIINDICALEGDPDSLAVAAASGASVVLMHMQGQPGDMQASPHYDDAPREVRDYLAARLEACVAAGISQDRLCIDPGIGFGKTIEHNLQILAALDGLKSLGVPVLLGVSRKSFVGALSRKEPPERRLGGSLAAALAGLDRGVKILRVHDVAETVQAVAVWHAIQSAQSKRDLTP